MNLISLQNSSISSPTVEAAGDNGDMEILWIIMWNALSTGKTYISPSHQNNRTIINMYANIV